MQDRFSNQVTSRATDLRIAAEMKFRDECIERSRAVSGDEERRFRLLAILAWAWLLVALPFITDAGCPFVIVLLLAVAWLVLALLWLCLPSCVPGSLGSRTCRRWWLASAAAG